jgi:hypothetical protein
MRHDCKAARASAASQIDSLPCGAKRGGKKIHSDGDNEVSSAKTGGSERRALLGSEHGRTGVICFVQHGQHSF